MPAFAPEPGYSSETQSKPVMNFILPNQDALHASGEAFSLFGNPRIPRENIQALKERAFGVCLRVLSDASLFGFFRTSGEPGFCMRECARGVSLDLVEDAQP